MIGTEGKIFGTNDGGVTWKPQASGVKENLDAITCTSETDCWAAGEGGIVLRTQDGGKKWRSVKVGTSENLYALDFQNSEFGLIVGGNGIVLRTQDGGRTWGSRQLNLILFPDGPFAATADLKAVRFVSGKVAWVAGSAGIAGTTDGGTTWSVILEEQSFIGLVSEGSEKGWAIGADGANFCTVDAGQHWQRCKPGT